MKSFKDANGREWQLSFNIGSAERIKDACGIDLLDLDSEAIKRMLTEVALIATVVFAAIKPQADKLEVSDVDFAEAIDGDCLDKMIDAFTGELINFTRGERKALLAKLLDKAKQLEQAAVERIAAAIDSPEMEQLIQAEIDKLDDELTTTLGATSGNSPALSG